MTEWKGVDGFKPAGKFKPPVEPNVITSEDPEYIGARADLDEWREPEKLPARKPLKKSDRALWTCSQCGLDSTYHKGGMCPTIDSTPMPDYRPDLIADEPGDDPRNRL